MPDHSFRPTLETRVPHNSLIIESVIPLVYSIHFTHLVCIELLPNDKVPQNRFHFIPIQLYRL